MQDEHNFTHTVSEHDGYITQPSINMFVHTPGNFLIHNLLKITCKFIKINHGIKKKLFGRQRNAENSARNAIGFRGFSYGPWKKHSQTLTRGAGVEGAL